MLKSILNTIRDGHSSAQTLKKKRPLFGGY